jgi:hypothetical protein
MHAQLSRERQAAYWTASADLVRGPSVVAVPVRGRPRKGRAQRPRTVPALSGGLRSAHPGVRWGPVMLCLRLATGMGLVHQARVPGARRVVVVAGFRFRRPCPGCCLS